MKKSFKEIVDADNKAMSFEEILKFNPYHDKLGRFASGSGFGVSSSQYTGDKSRQAVTFSANSKTKEGINAVDRHGGVVSAAYGRAKVEYKETDSETFTSTVKNSKTTVNENSRWRVTAYEKDEFNEYHSTATCYTTKGGSTFAIDKGDIVSVCKSKSDYASGKQLIEKAVEKGGTKLDSYEGNDAFYKKCGFEPVSWCKWSDEYAPSDWISANGYTKSSWDSMVKSGNTPKDSELKVGREDIVFYKHTGNKSTLSLDDFKAQVPVSVDYDTAYEARDNSIGR